VDPLLLLLLLLPVSIPLVMLGSVWLHENIHILPLAGGGGGRGEGWGGEGREGRKKGEVRSLALHDCLL